MIHTEEVVAEEIKAALLTPGAVNVESFANGSIKVAEVILAEDSPAVGRSVVEVDLPERSLILGGVRNGEALMSRGDTVLQARDHLFLISEDQRIPNAVATVVTDTEPVKEVMILGGGRIGPRLAQALEDADVSTKIIERDVSRVEYASSRLEKGTVVHAGDISQEVLRREGIEHTDAFISVTGDDRTNLLGARYARRLGARRTIADIGRGEFAPLAEALGVYITISPRLLAAGAISRFVRRGDVVTVTLLESGAQMIELCVSEKSPVARRPLAELDFPKEAIVGMLLRNVETIIPHGSNVLEPGGDVVVFTVNATLERVENLFSA